MPSAATRSLFSRFLSLPNFSGSRPQVTKDDIVALSPVGFRVSDLDGRFSFDLAVDPYRPLAHRQFQPAFAGLSLAESGEVADKLLLMCVQHLWGSDAAKLAGSLSPPQQSCYLHARAWAQESPSCLERIDRAAKNHPYLLAAAAFASCDNRADFFDCVFSLGPTETVNHLESAFQFFANQSGKDPMIAPRALGIGKPSSLRMRAALVGDAAEAVLDRKLEPATALWMLRAMVAYDKKAPNDSAAQLLSSYFLAVTQGAELTSPLPLLQNRVLDDPAALRAVINSIADGNSEEMAILVGTYKNNAVRRFLGGGEIPQIDGLSSFEDSGWAWKAIESPKELLSVVTKTNCLPMLPPPANSTPFYGVGPNEQEAVCAIDANGNFFAWLPMCQPAPADMASSFRESFAGAMNHVSDSPTPDPSKPAPNSLLGFPAKRVGYAVPFLAQSSVKTVRTSMASLFSQRIGSLSKELVDTCEIMAERFQVVCMHDPRNGQNVGYALLESGLCGATRESPCVASRLLTAHIDYLPDGSEPMQYLAELDKVYDPESRGFQQRPGVEMGVEALMIFASESTSSKEVAYARQQLAGAMARKGDFAAFPDLYSALKDFRTAIDEPLPGRVSSVGLMPPSMAKAL